MFNEVPVDPQITVPDKPVMSQEQIMREKVSYLRKLEALERKGHALTKKYDMQCDLDEMKGEYEMVKNDIEKRSSVRFQGKMMMALVSGIEFLNSKFDPLDIKLDGWGEAVSENLDEYDDVFGELHEKYGSKAKIAPELKLLFMLGGSAAMVHMTNTMFKTSMPGMDDIMKQNPELMHQFTQAAVNSMSNNNPGFGKFMGGVMNQGTTQRPPQAMAQAEQMRNMPPQQLPKRARPPERKSTRPDVNMARGPERTEMKGPSDISDLLSGLKTKTINLKNADAKSTISVEDIKELNTSMSARKQKTPAKQSKPKNIFSLNLN